jgi:adenylate cyclase
VTGQAVAGSLGSAERLKYTTLGDTVNVAARLESFQKDLWDPAIGHSPCRILIADSTAQWLDDTHHLRSIGELSLKGKQKKIRVFQLERTGGSMPVTPPTISAGGAR